MNKTPERDPHLFPVLKTAPTIQILPDCLSQYQGRLPSKCPFATALTILQERHPDIFGPLTFSAEEIPFAKERAIHYYVHGPGSVFSGYLLERSYLYGLSSVLNRGGKLLFDFSFPNIDQYTVPRWHVSVFGGYDEQPTKKTS